MHACSAGEAFVLLVASVLLAEVRGVSLGGAGLGGGEAQGSAAVPGWEMICSWQRPWCSGKGLQMLQVLGLDS